jgi:hypothetical protein
MSRIFKRYYAKIWICILPTRQQHVFTFSAYISRLTSLLASIKVSVFFFMLSIKRKPEADVSHLISVTAKFPGPS